MARTLPIALLIFVAAACKPAEPEAVLNEGDRVMFVQANRGHEIRRRARRLDGRREPERRAPRGGGCGGIDHAAPTSDASS